MKKIIVLLLAMTVLFSANAQKEDVRRDSDIVPDRIQKDTLVLGTYQSIPKDTLIFVSGSENGLSSKENMKSSVTVKKSISEELQPSVKKAVRQSLVLEPQYTPTAEEQREIELKRQLVAKESILQLSAPGILYVSEDQPVLKSATATTLGNTMQSPIVVGSFGSAFHYSNVQNTNNFTNDYTGKPSNDVFYKFTLTRAMIVSISHCGSPQWDTYIHLLDASGNRIDYNDDCSSGGCSYSMNSYLKKTLSAGTYYVVSEGYSANGEIKTTIGGAIIEGDNLPVPINAGTFYSGFQYTNSQNTTNFTNAYTGRPTNDVFHKFILSNPMIVEISHCSSTLSDTYLYLLDESGNRIDYNDDYSGTGKCSSTLHSYLKKTLLAGVYYVVSEGFSSNGVIATKIVGTVIPAGDILEFPISVGTYSDYFQYSNTQNTSGYHADYHYNTGAGRPDANDVFYKFTLSKKMIVTINHCGSGLDDTFLYLLDASGNYIAHNDDYSGIGRCSKTMNAFLEKELNAGTYYVVSEGYDIGGSVTTSITGFLNEFDYPATASGLNIGVANGTATGSIPIELPRGVNGLQPNISLDYGSNSGFGLAGYGWTLSGLSTISVTGKTLYHDNTVSPPASGNPLVLDGQRIITDGSNTVLENNRSVSVKASGSNYMVYYPDGSKATYTSHIAGYLWRITKFETSTGNYVTYSYSGNFISRIDYGGNGSGSHFASARFTYETNPDINTYYFGGQKLGYTQRIKKIEACVNSSVYRTYNLYYNSGYYKQLCRVDIKAGNQTLAPVTVTYGYNTQRFAVTSYEATPILHYDGPNHGNALIYSGKFCYWQSGDQVIIMQRKSSYATTDKILLYELTNSDGEDFAYTYQLEVGANFKQLLTANIDNTPESEIIKINGIEINVYTPSIYGGLAKLKTSTATGSSTSSKYIAGDFEGTGKQSILSVTPGTSYMDILRPMEGTYVLSNFNSTYNTDDIIFAMDYNGDGKTDVVHISSSGLKIHNRSGSSWVQIAATTSITKSTFTAQKLGNDYYIRTILVGDINGDGMTDLLVTPLCRKSGATYVMYSCDWKQYMSKGNGEFEVITNTQLMNTGPARGVNIDGGAFLQDMDGDGRADLVTSDASNNVIYYSDGSGFSNSNYHEINRPSSEDGLLTTLGNLSSNNNRFLAYTYRKKIYWVTYDRDERKESLLTKTGNTQADYNRIDMSGQNGKYFYSSGSGAAFPYRNVKYEPLYVVTNVKTSSGNTVISDKDYTYTNAVVHLQGLGFCGFESIGTYDRLRGQTVTETYEPYRFGLPKKMESPTQTSENTWSVSTTSTYPKNSFITLTKQKTTDKLTGNIVETSFQYNIYGMPTQKTTTKGSITETVSYTYEVNVSGTNWIMLPKTETTVQTYNGTTVNTVRSIDYNSKYLPSKKTVKTGSNKDKTVSEESLVYNVFGNVTSKTVKKYGSADVLTDSYTYSSNGRFVLTATNAIGQTTTYGYNDLLGLPLTSKDFKNNTTSYQYDSFGKLTKTTFPNGVIREETLSGTFSTNAVTNPKLTVTETGTPKQEILYDVFMREKSRGVQGFDGSMTYSNTEYNSKGEIYRVSELGSTSRFTTYTYDSYGRQTKVTAPSGKTTTYSYSGKSSTVNEHGFTKTTTLSSEGFIDKITDAAGEIKYSCRPDGQPKSITAPDGSVTSFGYDDYGRQTSITDPSAGLIQYAYDGNGYMNKQTDAESRISETVYNKYGLPTSSTVKKGSTTELSTSYVYNSDYMLTSVSAGGTSIAYTYDNLLRTATRTETVGGHSIKETYAYTSGKPIKVTYSGLSGTQPPVTEYIYENNYLRKIKSGSIDIKTINSKNKFGQTTQYTLGNGVVETRVINANGLLSQSKAVKGSTVIQDFGYSIDPLKGVLDNRKDNTRNITETFQYDSQRRLTNYTRNGQTEASVAYSSMGNIDSKTDAGTLEYNVPGKPYAIGKQTGNLGSVPERVQDIAYTGFQRPSTIEENGYKVTLTYGPDYGRNKMEVRNNNSLQYTRHYLGGNYEKDVPASGNTTERLYIGGSAYNAPAVYIRTGSGAWTLHYIHRDHLGSITAITNTAGSKIAEYSFDPWGRQRNPANQQAYAPDAAPSLLLGRGYTGHEHLPMFGLVNMNARLYDPVLGRFLSPDPYMQAPNWSQSFNRYSYCLNNPLIFVDTDGEKWQWWLLVGDIFSGGLISSAIISTGVFVHSTFEAAALTINNVLSAADFTYTFFETLITGDVTKGAQKFKNWGMIEFERIWSITGAFDYDQTANWFEWPMQVFNNFGGEFMQDNLGGALAHYENMAGNIDDVGYYKGRMIIRTKDNTINSGISLGHYVFGDNIALNPNDTEHDLDLFAHEFGHTYQSRIMGSLYIYRTGIASVYDNNGLAEMDANRRGFENLGMTPSGPLAWQYLMQANSKYKWWEFMGSPVLWPFMWMWNY
jgi:RHS repeat-associated protein